jgi:ubiquinone/menaquinone biosynthesis C-methylase UbiE
MTSHAPLTETEQRAVQQFYDRYWPDNLPDARRTQKHIFSLLPLGERFTRALDGGCGTGVCSVALAQAADSVVACDIALRCAGTTRDLARSWRRSNVTVVNGDLLRLPFGAARFDLVLSWGVIHHTADPLRALDELVRVTARGGLIVVGVYERTRLSWLHELIRTHVALRLGPGARRAFIATVAAFVRVMERLGKTTQLRDDNPRIESQIEDWFFVPIKYFFTQAELREAFERRGVSYEVVADRTARFRATSIFIARGRKR